MPGLLAAIGKVLDNGLEGFHQVVGQLADEAHRVGQQDGAGVGDLMWKHLERQEGAIGTRGPGETQLESDRRVLRRKIAKLEGDPPR